jgi:hypothetical protein
MVQEAFDRFDGVVEVLFHERSLEELFLFDEVNEVIEFLHDDSVVLINRR